MAGRPPPHHHMASSSSFSSGHRFQGRNRSPESDDFHFKNQEKDYDRYRYTVRNKEETEELRSTDTPIYRGPEGLINFDNHLLKKFTVEIIRNHEGYNGPGTRIVSRGVAKPEDIILVRRPDEGSRPLFERLGDIVSSSNSDDEEPKYTRFVSMDEERIPERSHSPRYRGGRSSSPHYYEDQRSPYMSRESSPMYREQSPRRRALVGKKIGESPRSSTSSEDLRRNLDFKRKFSPDRYERESGVRERTRVKKRADSFSRDEDDWEEFPPGSLNHGRPYRPERESEDEWRGAPHVREYISRGRDFDRGGPSRYQADYSPKKFFKRNEERMFTPYQHRGRGGPSVRKFTSPFIRGRGALRGNFRGFRGGTRGGPRGFMGNRGRFPRRPAY